ncbi:MAG: hypothetical protein WCJ14_10370 [Verrucomicrobiota bacterium]
MINLRLSTGLAAIGCILLASCYPVNENPRHKRVPRAPEKTAITQDPQKLTEQEALKQKDQATLTQGQVTDNPGTLTPPVDKPKPPVEPKRDYAFANKVPGKDGFVFSPYNNKVVDVRDIPTGTLVQDPTYPPAEKKYFRVP